LRLFEYFDQGSSFRLLFLRVDCECNQPSFLATVFKSASAFNGDLSRWDVAKVTTMSDSKSIWIVENDLTCRELMLL
jgi:surface protein